MLCTFRDDNKAVNTWYSMNMDHREFSYQYEFAHTYKYIIIQGRHIISHAHSITQGGNIVLYFIDER